MTDGARPDPDELLRRVTASEKRAARARLTVFLGFAPGVGKTYRMLQAARDRMAAGDDVLVGVVETHQRAETAEQLFGLEFLPLRRVDHLGRQLTELDLDAALARKPALLLVDELAHTNAPGSRHAKRWQDVLELLDAGIEVMTTVNVQHVESLNDVVARITGVSVRETVPDHVLERADAVEVIDLGIDELRQRLKEGKVYLGDQAVRASEHFFKPGNLLALRELALRLGVDRVDADVRAFRDEHGVRTTWQTGERILVCIGPAPSSERLVRAARRVAAGLRAPWAAVWVDRVTAPLSSQDRARLEAHLRLVEQLGGEVVSLSSETVPEAILEHARRHNVTRIIVGKPTHGRWRDRLRGSLLDALVRGSGDIDLQVISGDSDAFEAPHAPAVPEPAAPPTAYVASVLVVALTTGLGFLLDRVLGVPDVEMAYLLGVMLVALVWGRGPALLAAGLAVAGFDLFFVEPYFTFAVADARYVLTFAMLFASGVVVGELVTRLRRQERLAHAREARSAALFALTRDLGGASAADDIARLLAEHLARALSVRTVALLPAENHLRVAGPPHPLSPDELGVARWTFEHAKPAGRGTDTLPGSTVTAWPLALPDGAQGVLLLHPAADVTWTADQRALLDLGCRQAAVALSRLALADEARRSEIRARAESMRSALLSTVSHDLRTPLAVITGAATALRTDDAIPAENKAELLETIVDESAHLDRLVANLLDMTRVESGELAPKREWVPAEELIGAALARVESALVGRDVSVSCPADLPLFHVDPVLFGQVLVNLLENAGKYVPSGKSVRIEARAAGDALELEVSDTGPGLPAGDASRLFEKFVRGDHVRGPGAGLGLAICRGIVEAHGGTITARNRPEGGASFTVRLPLVRPPEEVAHAE